ncbi:MAG: acetate/propionate family kinase [Thermoguttaceae bacterium]|jgi:acetate kinase|nr:acetate/propionate family kinase [Thermoguttaceae bacterium]
MSILVLNAGSSSVKFGVFDFDTLEPTARGMLDWAGAARRATITLKPPHGEPVRQEIDAPDYRTGVIHALKMLKQCPPRLGDPSFVDRRFRVVGHRLIHGGEEIRRPVVIDAPMKKTIRRFIHLAPLHIPAGLEAIEAAETALPGVLQVGLFDTAFFADIPPAAYLYPVPYSWYEEWGIRRFGFHGTSHAYCTERAAEMLGAAPGSSRPLRLVICHLGQGSSATAVRDGVAITNTMGFTPLEGFMMGTRSGTVDPGILLYVLREKGLSVAELDDILHHKSGLLGISGLSSDFRQVEAAALAGHARARLAIDIYAYRVRTMIGALAVTLGGLDALVFTGGIGENSVWLRSEVCKGLECLGVHLDAQRNASVAPDGDVATGDSPARVLLIHTREDYMIAREARRLALESQHGGG